MKETLREKLINMKDVQKINIRKKGFPEEPSKWKTWCIQRQISLKQQQ